MSPSRIHVALLAAVLFLVAAVPAGASEGDTKSTTQDGSPGAPEECLNVAVDRLAAGFDVFVSVFGVIGVGISSPKPDEGVTAIVYVVPEMCTVTFGASLPVPAPASLHAAPAAVFGLLP